MQAICTGGPDPCCTQLLHARGGTRTHAYPPPGGEERPRPALLSPRKPQSRPSWRLRPSSRPSLPFLPVSGPRADWVQLPVPWLRSGSDSSSLHWVSPGLAFLCGSPSATDRRVSTSLQVCVTRLLRGSARGLLQGRAPLGMCSSGTASPPCRSGLSGHRHRDPGRAAAAARELTLPGGALRFCKCSSAGHGPRLHQAPAAGSQGTAHAGGTWWGPLPQELQSPPEVKAVRSKMTTSLCCQPWGAPAWGCEPLAPPEMA